MIDAKDLRIGDIVKVSADGRMIAKDTVCKVVAIDSEDTFKDMKGKAALLPLERERWELSAGIWCEYIAPVPLTPSVLEANGWKQKRHIVDEDGFEWYAYSHDPDMAIDMNFYPDDGADFSAFFLGNELMPAVRYVHQFQHLLWALGEDAEIIV